MAASLIQQLLKTVDGALPVHIRPDQTGIDGEALAADQLLSDAPRNRHLEQFT
jgi:hypothetical protein